MVIQCSIIAIFINTDGFQHVNLGKLYYFFDHPIFQLLIVMRQIQRFDDVVANQGDFDS